MKKFLSRLLVGVVILALLLVAGGAFYFKSYLPNTVAEKSFPQIYGEIQLDQLDGRCPLCASPEILIEGGRDLMLESIELEET